MGRVCDRIKQKIKVDNSKVLVVRKDKRANTVKVKVNVKGLEEVAKCKRLGMMISGDGAKREEVIHRLHEKRKIWETLGKLGRRIRHLEKKNWREMFEIQFKNTCHKKRNTN